MKVNKYSEPVSVSMYQVRYKSLIFYNHCLERRGPSPELLQKFRENKTYAGVVTKGAQKRIRRSVDRILQLSEVQKIYNPVINSIQKFRLNFITLTVANTDKNYTAREMYDLCFKPFLRWLRETKKSQFYIWKAELQKRGQVHYHVVSNRFIMHDEIKAKWNELQKKAGLLEGFFNKFNHYNPNSTDIHAVYKVKDLSAYFSKYLSKITKDDDGNTIDETTGKVWDCSRALKEFKTFTAPVSIEMDKRLKIAVKNKSVSILYLEKCSILKSGSLSVLNVLSAEDKAEYLARLKDHKRNAGLITSRPRLVRVAPVPITRPALPTNYRPPLPMEPRRPVIKQLNFKI